MRCMRWSHWTAATGIALALASAVAAPPDTGASGAATRGTLVVVASCEDSGPGTLREAVASAPPGSTIDLSALPCPDRTITLTSGEIAFQNDAELTMTGMSLPRPEGVTIPQAILDGNGASRIFSQHGAGTLSLFAIELRHGHSAQPGGCLASEGDVALTESLVDGCEVVATEFGAGVGGGVYVAGALALDSSVIRDNLATGESSVNGGGASAGSLLMAYSTVSGNSAIATSVFGFGGGLYVMSHAQITNSTISGNRATDLGGIELVGDGGTARLRIADTTISGNVGGSIGGLLALQSPVKIASSTIAFNTATNGGTGGLAVGNSPVLESTIAADNVGLDVAEQCLTPPCGLVVEGADNLIVATDMPVPPETIDTDPRLLPLANNGGRTLTHALLAGSPAIDRGNVLGADTGPLDYDQRGPGYPRVVEVAADIGAFEFRAAPDFIFIDGFDCGEAVVGRSPQVCP